ncbi:hypothetical protein L2E82_16913 [Cichorium intybus]|uniref:Uncharacterized protein n=1 Tax=Cichorium intybus TaxID=13427 RepID=A0ACB9F673_CICIN|nr:hypothetical protein L2E82_16913 [Cichorium intybus]
MVSRKRKTHVVEKPVAMVEGLKHPKRGKLDLKEKTINKKATEESNFKEPIVESIPTSTKALTATATSFIDITVLRFSPDNLLYPDFHF